MLEAFRKRFSRRRLFVFAGGLFSSILAACSLEQADETDDDSESPTPTATPEPRPSPTPTPTPSPSPIATPSPTATARPTPEPQSPVRYWLEPGIADSSPGLVERVTGVILESPGADSPEPAEADSEAEADVLIRRPAGRDGEIIVYGQPLIPVAAIDQYCPGLTVGQIEEMLAGTLTNWIEVEGQDREVVPALHPSAERYGFSAEFRVGTPDQLPQQAGSTPGLVALVPRSWVTFHVHSLYVDDIDPLREELRPDIWPWWEQIAVSLAENSEGQDPSVIADELDELNAGARARARTMLSAVGDVCLGRTIHTTMVQQGDWRAPYRLVTDELQRGDLTIGNLECAITGSFDPPADPRTFSFMTFPEAVDGLAFAGFTALSGANNHAMDFGVTGMRDTVAALSEYGIQHFGAGDDLEAARQPCLLEHDGTTFALLGYDAISMHYAGATAESGGVSPMVRDYVTEDIQRAREQADVVIPFFHWGVEYTLTPTEGDRQMAHAAIDAGADLVLGGHPHWVQGMEIYQGRPIFYSLSNFIFDQEWSFETKQGFILHLTFDRAELVGFRVVPVLIEDFYRPRIVEDDVRTTILGRFWESTGLIAD